MRHVVVSPCSSVELLPKLCPAEEAKGEFISGVCYSSWVGPECKLCWQPVTPLTSAHNPIASTLAGGIHITGDCILELPLNEEATEEDAAAMLAEMLAAQRTKLNRLNQWAMLPPEVLGIVCCMSGYHANAMVAMSQVCKSWRMSLAEEKSVWRKLQLQRIDVGSKARMHRHGLPWLVKNALLAGNVQAFLSLARFFEKHGDLVEAQKFWYKAAKRGHAEAQWHVGVGHYKGLHGAALDAEEAILWLSKAAKQLLDALERPGPKELPMMMTEEQCCHVLSQSANILGYSALDGEGMQADTSIAVKWFKVALKYGCSEASSVLGSLFRSGQF